MKIVTRFRLHKLYFNVLIKRIKKIFFIIIKLLIKAWVSCLAHYVLGQSPYCGLLGFILSLYDYFRFKLIHIGLLNHANRSSIE